MRLRFVLSIAAVIVGISGAATTSAAASAYRYDISARSRVDAIGVVCGGAQADEASTERGAVQWWPGDLVGGARRGDRTAIATEAEGAGLSEAFRYTGSQNVASIEANGLRSGSYATPSGELSPLQAQIDLALPPNCGLPGATLRIDVAGLREAGYEIPEVTQVGRSYNMPSGGYEMQFGYPIPPEFIKAVP